MIITLTYWSPNNGYCGHIDTANISESKIQISHKCQECVIDPTHNSQIT